MENITNAILSSFEKKIIDTLISLDESNDRICLQNIFTARIIGTSTEFEFHKTSDSEFILHYCKELNIASDTDKEFIKNTEKKLYNVVLLLEALEKRNYIVLVERENGAKQSSQNSAYGQNIPLNHDLQKRICALWDKDLFVSLSLKELKQHDYLEENLFETRKQNKWYRILTIATILVSLLSIGVQIYLAKQNNTQKVSIESVNDTVKIEPYQVEK